MILTRYFLRELLTSTFVITGILMLIVVSARLVVHLNKAVAGIIPPEAVFYTILYNSPGFLQLILPLGFYISILLVYGRMHSENEMTVLHATGFGPKQVFRITMAPVGVMMFLIGFLSLWLAPTAADKLDEYYQIQQQESEFSFITPGRFNAIGSNGKKVSYAQTLSADRKQMQNVFMADGDTVILAESGRQYVDPESGSRYLELLNGRRHAGEPGKQQLETLMFDSYSVKIAEESSVAKKARNEAASTYQLYLSKNRKDKARLHYRIGLFLLVPIIVLIAFPLSHVKPRQGRYGKMLPAIVVYMVYYTMLITARKWMEQGQTPLWMGLWWLHACFILLGGLLMYWPTVQLKMSRRKANKKSKGAAHA
ncbi:LPS export ABC transporter permease LptF [Bermanella sp. WJH001]|uniref:LPS export ABC transporter permease LptF n=1 Tax=Bermanella sp. WJH001 TaxID=3048005 RepID=UPI0024BD912E|nr:LPS export ABC transporter permease LptF [Bermanella sp. WJH001]MDJ1538411.1 LPS export ABC transporter permease LptF [Bermanella sp. WJH001]